MIRARSDKPGGSENPLEDPAFIQEAMRSLFDAEAEFPIKVEGTSTLPYTSVIKEIRGSKLLVLKLIRPLPHELMKGAVFQLVFPFEDKRYQGTFVFQGREGYLQYGFTVPTALVYADRRNAKRFPFRPRENAYVIAQDSRVPSIGVAGPLVNIGMGGFAMRVDRVLKLDDGMRVPASTALFERDKGFPRVRIQDLPKLPVFEWRGMVAHSTARGEEVILGCSFGELGDEQSRALGDCLAFREKAFRGGGQAPTRSESAPAPKKAGPRDAAPEESPVLQAADSADQGAEELLERLQRRARRVLLCMPEGERRGQMLEHLSAQGFLRLECVSDVAALQTAIQPQGSRPPAGWILVDLALAEEGDVEPLAALRALERDLGDLGGVPVAMLCERVDPTLLLAFDSHVRILPYHPEETEEAEAWRVAVEALTAS